MPTRSLFATPVYEASLAEARDFAAFNAELEEASRMLAAEDTAGEDTFGTLEKVSLTHGRWSTCRAESAPIIPGNHRRSRERPSPRWRRP